MPTDHNLIALWMWASTRIPGHTLASAVRELAEHVGRPIRQSRIYEWRDGVQTPPPAVQAAMMADVIEMALELALDEAPGTYRAEQLDELAAWLSLPMRH